MEKQTRDQVIRGFFWPDDFNVISKFGLPAATTATTGGFSNKVALTGWQEGYSPAGPVEVTGHRVKQDDTSFRIVVGQLKGM